MGTVDKFQGRQAPVVICSMTTSSIEEIPRGLEFLLSQQPPERRRLEGPGDGRPGGEPEAADDQLPVG